MAERMIRRALAALVASQGPRAHFLGCRCSGIDQRTGLTCAQVWEQAEAALAPPGRTLMPIPREQADRNRAEALEATIQRLKVSRRLLEIAIRDRDFIAAEACAREVLAAAIRIRRISEAQSRAAKDR